MSEVVLDASALLAVLNEEPGGEKVDPVLSKAALSTVNLSEVIARLAEKGMTESETRETVQDLGVSLHPFDDDLAYAAGHLRPQTKPFGLSLGDRACLALGLRLSLPVMTADRAWGKLDLAVDVQLIR